MLQILHLYFFSLNNSFTQKIYIQKKLSINIHAAVAYLIYIRLSRGNVKSLKPESKNLQRINVYKCFLNVSKYFILKNKCFLKKEKISLSIKLDTFPSKRKIEKIYSFVPNCREEGSNKMHHGENYQDFLKWGIVFRSFSYNN